LLDDGIEFGGCNDGLSQAGKFCGAHGVH
jgi:hypothetical protein